MTETRHDQLIREHIAEQPANYHHAKMYAAALLDVLDLHQPDPNSGAAGTECIECSSHAPVYYPCPTVERIARHIHPET